MPKDGKSSVTGERWGQLAVGHPVGAGDMIGFPEQRLCSQGQGRGSSVAALKPGDLGGGGHWTVKLSELMSEAAEPSMIPAPYSQGCPG